MNGRRLAGLVNRGRPCTRSRVDGDLVRPDEAESGDQSPAAVPTRASREAGSISIYILGMVLVAVMLIVVTVAITSVSLARVRLMDAADSAALVAANAFDENTYSANGIRQAVPVSDATVQQAAGQHLGSSTMPPGFITWWVDAGTGTPDGQTAVVVLSADVRIPMAGVLLGDRASIRLSVESRARAATQ